MEKNNEIIDKLKESVMSKLKELDSSKNYDCTLIDYILVMVVNQKSKYEMKHNLALFLGKISDDFVNWLFEYLSQLKMNPNNINFQSDLEIRKEEVKEEPPNRYNNDTNIDSNDDRKIESNENINHDKSVKDSKESRITKKKLKSAIVNCIMPEEDENDQKKRSNKRRLMDNHLQKPPKKQRSVIKTNEKDSAEEIVTPEPNVAEKDGEMKFFVTLDGVKNMFKVDDLFLMDEEFDPELMNEDVTGDDQLTSNKKEKFTKDIRINKFERCRYWPFCLNGKKCDYYHPLIKCNLFPHCRYGDKCLYIHPICKYDYVCSRKDCPFFHTATKRCQQSNNSSNNVICKYYPNCINPVCEFLHPKVCHFGNACKTFNCPFIHPHQTLPHPSQLKWSSKNKEIEIK